jgi:hypothetical protein
MGKKLKAVIVLSLFFAILASPAFCKTKKSPAKAKSTSAASAPAALTAAAKPAAPADLTPEYLSKFTGGPDFKITKSFKTGFEGMEDFKDFYVTPAKYTNASREISGENAHGGNASDKAWITGPESTSPAADAAHRAYPSVQMYKNIGTFYGVVFTEFWVWTDIQLTGEPGMDWLSIAAFCTYSDDAWQRTININIGKDGILQLANVPVQQQNVSDISRATDTKFPMKQWVKIDALLDFGTDNEYKSPYIKVWQDEKPVSAARFNPHIDPASLEPATWPSCLDGWDGQNVEDAERLCGLIYEGGLAQAHFGLTAAPLLSAGTVYNDGLIIYELAK